MPGRERPTLRLLSDVDDWQAWPWELLPVWAGIESHIPLGILRLRREPAAQKGRSHVREPFAVRRQA